MKTQKKTIAFTGGGTGGHVFPAFAVYEKLLEDPSMQGSRYIWIGSRQGMEKAIVERRGIPYFGVPAGKLRRYLSLKNVSDIGRILAAIFASRRILRRERVAVLFSKGGFVSVPPVIAARSLGIPVISHESDLDPGLATRINGRFSRQICCAYEESLSTMERLFPGRCLVTGNPVRREIREGRRGEGRRLFQLPREKPLLLVLGGSQGALQINTLVEGALDRLLPLCSVVHQMGSAHYRESDRSGYHTAAFFTDELPHLLADADLVLSRSGAGTLWENGVSSSPALLVPLGLGASRGDQIRNAKLFASAEAAAILEGSDGGAPDSRDLADVVERMLSEPGTLESMAKAAHTLCNADAAERISALIRDAGGV